MFDPVPSPLPPDPSADAPPSPSARARARRRTVSAWLLAAAGLLTLTIWLTYASVHRAARQEAQAQGLITLQSQARELLGAVEKFEHLPYLVGAEQTLTRLLQAPQDAALRAAANAYLRFAQQRTGVAAVYLMDVRGLTLAASNWDEPSSFVGRDYGFRPYFQQALAGDTGRFYGIGVTTGEPGAFLAAPLRGGGEVVGVVAIKIDLAERERHWRDAGLQLALADGNGVIFLTAAAEWRYRSLFPLESAAQQTLRRTRQYGDLQPEPLDPQPAPWPGPALQSVRAQDEARWVQGLPLPTLDWRMLLFTDPAGAHAQALMAAELAGLSLALVLLVAALVSQSRRHRSERLASARERERAIAALEQRIAERTAELTAANDVAVQTGKLALLGQMAASISHELAQPLAALRTLADNAVVLLDQGREDVVRSNLGHIGGLCTRMGRIVGELKVFARKEPARLEPVPLQPVLASALMLIEPLRRASGARIVVEPTPLVLMGDGMRLEQVLVNLLRNALEAMEGQPERLVEMTLEADEQQVHLRIRDHGPGLSEAVLAHLFEPFFTTKPSGKGLGLGLALSQAIVQAMGGTMRAHNAAPGACFELSLPRARLDVKDEPHGRAAD